MLLGYIVYVRLYIPFQNGSVQLVLPEVSATRIITYAFAFVLLWLMNISLESVRWQVLTQHIRPSTFFSSLKSVLMGLAVGVVTPSRVGEYGGRLVDIPRSKVAYSLTAQFIGSLAQNLTNIFFGTLGLYLILLGLYPETPYLTLSFLSFGMLATAFFLLVYYRFDIVIKILPVPAFIARQFPAILKVAEHMPEPRVLNKALLLSVIRYAVYLTQSVLVLHLFDIQIPVYMIFAGMSSIFLIQSGLVLPPMLGFVARIEISLLIFSFLNIDPLVVMTCSLLIWTINLLIPALIGSIFLLRTNISKVDQNEN